MKRTLARVVAVCLLCHVGPLIARGDMFPPGPLPPDPPEWVQKERRSDRYPTYAIAAGVVAVALAGSLVALRTIRKNSSARNP